MKAPQLFSKQIQAFQAVATELHFGRAAQRLHSSQPPLSQHVRILEESMGVKLIERTTRSVRLTPAGRLLFDALKRMTGEGQSAITAAQRTSEGTKGLLRLGFTSTAAYRLVPPALEAYRRDYPDVELSLTERLSAPLLEELLDDRVDIALIRRPDNHLALTALAFDLVDRENMLVALPPNHPLATLDEVPVDQFHDLPAIGFHPTSGTYLNKLMAEFFQAHGVKPRVVMESVLPTMLALVQAGIGVAFVPSSVSEQWQTGVAYRPLRRSDQPPEALLYAARNRHNLSRTLHPFLEILKAR